MLVSIHVKNFAIIDEATLDFGKGFNVLTGETGAGKSILIGSLNAALGGKVSKEMLGSKADYALVELVFETDSPEIKKLFDENDLIYDEQIIISRRISLSGRNVCRINGETVTASTLKEIAELLVDIHGQHEHQSLLHKPVQRKIADSFGHLTEKADEVGKAYREYRDALNALEAARKNGRLSERELDLVRYELQEIRAAAVKEGEDEELSERYRILSNTDKIVEALSTVADELTEKNGSASESVDAALKSLSRVSHMDGRLSDIFDGLNMISDRFTELASEVRDYIDEVRGSEEEFAETGARLDVINRIKSKYGDTVKEIEDYAAACEQKLAESEDYGSWIAGLEDKVSERLKILAGLSERLTADRKAVAEKLSGMVSEELEELNFQNAVFEVRLIPIDGYSENGAEEIEFFISTNLGEPLKSLSKCASGGELSRIMLAIKHCMVNVNQIDSLIFDEIDTGISGRTAQKVSEKMSYLAMKHQVICITHLPQIAAMADTHFLIEKKQTDGKTVTEISELGREEMQAELARMLGGTVITESVLANAGEMKALADEWKKNRSFS